MLVICWCVRSAQHGLHCTLCATFGLQSSQTLGSGQSAFDRTIKSLYSAAAPDAYVMYNDETPAQHTASSHAHMKVRRHLAVRRKQLFVFTRSFAAQGILAIDGGQGFWLIHSVPKFPDTLADYQMSGYSFPTGEAKYAQSFMCLTLAVGTFETVAQSLLVDWPQIYDSAINAALTTKLPSLAALINGQKTSGASAIATNITTAGGKPFLVFAKNREWDSYLYTDLVAPTLNDGLYVESWLNGVGKVGSVCGTYKIFDVLQMSLPDGSSWSVNQDHSKWAITQQMGWSCVGDINRESGQTKRGGGTVCTYDSGLWGAFQSTISNVNKTCGRST